MHLTCKNTSFKSDRRDWDDPTWKSMRSKLSTSLLRREFWCSSINHEWPNKEATVPSDDVGSKSDCENRTGTKTGCCGIEWFEKRKIDFEVLGLSLFPFQKKWQVRHWTSPVISVSHASLFVGLVLAWTTSPPAKEVLHLYRWFTHTHTHHLSHTTLSHTISTLSHTIFDTPSFTHHFVTHHFVTHHLSHTIFHTPSFSTPFFTHNFVTHHLLHTIFHTPLCYTASFATPLCHTPLCHTPSFTHNFVTHSLSHTTFTHTIFHTQLFHTHTHTPSFFVTHHLSHATLSHTTLFYFSILHRLLCFSFLPRPRYNTMCSLLEEVVLWGYPVL